jgi:hypothetical protein
VVYIDYCEDCVPCPDCGGKGERPSQRIPCPEPACVRYAASRLLGIGIPPYCGTCRGSGQVVLTVTCSTCNGTKGQACDYHRRKYAEF